MGRSQERHLLPFRYFNLLPWMMTCFFGIDGRLPKRMCRRGTPSQKASPTNRTSFEDFVMRSLHLRTVAIDTNAAVIDVANPFVETP